MEHGTDFCDRSPRRLPLHDALLHAAQSDSPNEGFHWGAILNTTRAGHPGSHWFSLFVYCPPSMVPTPVPADGVADDAAGSAPPGPSDDGAPGGVVADGRDGGVERGDGDANLAPADFSKRSETLLFDGPRMTSRVGSSDAHRLLRAKKRAQTI